MVDGTSRLASRFDCDSVARVGVHGSGAVGALWRYAHAPDRWYQSGSVTFQAIEHAVSRADSDSSVDLLLRDSEFSLRATCHGMEL